MQTRERLPEWMDDPGLDPTEHARALRGLARLNWLSNSASVLWPSLNSLARQKPSRPLTVLDVATGSGDLPIQLARRARRAGLSIDFHACDISPTALTIAKTKADQAQVSIHLFALDVLKESIPHRYDVVMSSLFLHHLSNSESVQVLQKLSQAATRMLLVNDLCRSRWNYWLVWLGTRLVTRSPVVHYDGPVSVRAAYTVEELLCIARQAGLDRATVEPAFPARLLLKWARS